MADKSQQEEAKSSLPVNADEVPIWIANTVGKKCNRFAQKPGEVDNEKEKVDNGEETSDESELEEQPGEKKFIRCQSARLSIEEINRRTEKWKTEVDRMSEKYSYHAYCALMSTVSPRGDRAMSTADKEPMDMLSYLEERAMRSVRTPDEEYRLMRSSQVSMDSSSGPSTSSCSCPSLVDA